MKKLLALLLMLLCSSFANAGCIVGDKFSLNKSLHLAGTASLVAIGSALTDDVRWGLAAGAAAGIVRELYKVRTPGMACEYSSMLYDMAGLGLGYVVSEHFIILPRRNGVVVSYSKQF